MTKPAVVFILMIALIVVSVLAGSMIGDINRVFRLARKNGWTKTHHDIYEELVQTCTKLVAKEQHESILSDPMMMSVMLPAEEGARIRAALLAYRKEKGIE